MEFKDLQILGSKFGRTISVDYYNKVDSKNYTVENDQVPHPDLRNALMALQDDLAEAYYTIGDKESFVPNGFVVHEKEGTFYLVINGKFETRHEDTVTINSGKIPMSSSPTNDLVVKLNLLRKELYDYMWGGKSAEQELPFEKKDEKDPDED